MSEMSAVGAGTSEARSSRAIGSSTTIVLSLLLIVGLPAAFWMAVLELANYALSIGLTNTGRLVVATALLGLLTLIWGSILMSARQRHAL